MISKHFTTRLRVTETEALRTVINTHEELTRTDATRILLQLGRKKFEELLATYDEEAEPDFLLWLEQHGVVVREA